MEVNLAIGINEHPLAAGPLVMVEYDLLVDFIKHAVLACESASAELFDYSPSQGLSVKLWPLRAVARHIEQVTGCALEHTAQRRP
jgi:hypothetical protein